MSFLAVQAPAIAQVFTWADTNAVWNNNASWTPAGIPDAAGESAVFNAATTFVTPLILADITVESITFNGPTAFTINSFANMTIQGAGIVNNSGVAQIINNAGVFGTIGFTGSATAGTNVTINNTGILSLTQFLNNSNAGSATINNVGTNAGTLFDNNSSARTATINNVSDSSTIQFAGQSTAGNATVNNGGPNTVIIFTGTASGGSATFINGAPTAFIQISTLTSAGTTFGSLQGVGVVELGAKNLAIGSNGKSTTFAGVIQGAGGSLTLAGPGSLNLTGTNTYTGTTTVNGGTLSVNGSTVTSALTTVNAGGTLAGAGTVGATTISGGTLSPGNSVGTITVQGSLVFTAASSYLVEVSPTGADRTNVTGTATLGGARVVAVYSGSVVNTRYRILNATGGVIGTFNPQVLSNLPAFTSTLTYDANNVYLSTSLNYANIGNLNQNQTNVGNALAGFFNRTGGIPLVFGTLTAAGLTQLSGETATGSQQTTFNAMTQFLGLMTDPFIAGRDEGASQGGTSSYADEALGYAGKRKPADALAAIYTKAPRPADPYLPRWSVWAAGYGGSQTTDGNVVLGSNTVTSRIAAGAVGLDYRFSPYTLAGFAMAGGGTNFSVAGGGTGRSDLFQAGAFVRHNVGPAYLTAALAYGWQDVTTDRTVTVAGLDRLNARFDANAFSGRLEGGYRFVTPVSGIGLTPYAAAQFTTFDLPAYAERALFGANTFALAFASRDVTASRGELGLRSDKSYLLNDGLFTLRGRVAWAHDGNTDRSIQATFQTLPGASFVVNGARPARDAALTTASAEMKWRNGWSAAATFEGEFSDVTRGYAGKGAVRYAW